MSDPQRREHPPEPPRPPAPPASSGPPRPPGPPSAEQRDLDGSPPPPAPPVVPDAPAAGSPAVPDDLSDDATVVAPGVVDELADDVTVVAPGVVDDLADDVTVAGDEELLAQIRQEIASRQADAREEAAAQDPAIPLSDLPPPSAPGPVDDPTVPMPLSNLSPPPGPGSAAAAARLSMTNSEPPEADPASLPPPPAPGAAWRPPSRTRQVDLVAPSGAPGRPHVDGAPAGRKPRWIAPVAAGAGVLVVLVLLVVFVG